jgi:glycosyltransferase involved in cell wall biosynthesis
MPYYNSEETIKYSIISVLNQTYQDFELLIVNDGSTDSSRSIVEEIKDKRIRHINLDRSSHQKYRNGVNIDGGYFARNIGLEIANGKYITFQDSDDIAVLNRLEIQLNLLKKDDLDHLTTSYIEFYDNSNLVMNRLINYDLFKKNVNIKEINLNQIKYILNKCTSPFSNLPDKVFQSIPFSVKKIFFLKNLFFPNSLNSKYAYPGAAGVCFFKSKIKKNIKFRHLNLRRWPSMKGRGADRDFNFQIIKENYNSKFFDIPLYFWRVKKEAKLPYYFDQYFYTSDRLR